MRWALPIGVLFGLSFPALAAIQLAVLLVSGIGLVVDLKRIAPDIFPSLAFWDGSAVREILHGSGHFGLITASTFLTYQVPLLILQRVVGPVAVAAFILMRTLFSMSRQLLAILTQSFAPEITVQFGRNDWPSLAKLYDYSERIVFFLIAVVNVTVLTLSPVLIAVWLHRKSGAGTPRTVAGLFAVTPYVLAAAISIVLSLKEHKMQFQFSTNTHVTLARLTFFSYLAMVLVSVGAVTASGVNGFLWTWLVTEAFQSAGLIRLNARLFAHFSKIDTRYVTRLVALCGTALALSIPLLARTHTLPLLTQTALALAAGSITAAIAWYAFHVQPVAGSLLTRFRRREA